MIFNDVARLQAIQNQVIIIIIKIIIITDDHMGFTQIMYDLYPNALVCLRRAITFFVDPS